MKHSISIQIRMSDLDAYGHVNNGAQCNLFDFARANYIEDVLGKKIDWTNFDLVLVNINVDFKNQILIHDKIICKSEIYEIGNKSMKMRQYLVDSETDTIKTICHSVFAAIDKETYKSKPVPEAYRKCVSSYEGLND
ncbi:acyl-CoA thioesterase [Odoribacter sp. OttesenSCG-928-L07]|nr:acyl-CoA thioesterase [Odoribacter sp. OttesenSCG-928-L07]MDL2238674.1 acyl-CoA thioesterase [Bacteroidales bacterium OttesenSCG-928-L14]